MTVIYNTETEKLDSKFLKNGYLVDGEPGVLSPNQIELAVVYNIKPEISTNENGTLTGYTTENWVVDLPNQEYRKEYQTIPYSSDAILQMEKDKYLSSLKWEDLEDKLETTYLPSATGTTSVSGETVVTGETYFERAITTTNSNAYSLLLNCITDKWDKRLPVAFTLVKNNLPVALTSADVDKLNEILSECNFQFTL